MQTFTFVFLPSHGSAFFCSSSPEAFVRFSRSTGKEIGTLYLVINENASWSCVSVYPSSTSWPCSVNNQIVCLLSVGMFNHVMKFNFWTPALVLQTLPSVKKG